MKQTCRLFLYFMWLTLFNSNINCGIEFNRAMCKKYTTPIPAVVPGNLIVQGNVTARNLNALDTLAAPDANITNSLTANNVNVTGDLRGVNATFSGSITASNANFTTIGTDTLTGTDGSFNGTVSTTNLEVARSLNLGNPPFDGGAVNINGEVWATSFNTISDGRLKENICCLDKTESLNKICSLNPVTFCFTEVAKKSIRTRDCKNEGFIAQEVQKIIPNAVSQCNECEGMLAINYEVIVTTLVSALQEANKKVEELSARVDKLEKTSVKNK